MKNAIRPLIAGLTLAACAEAVAPPAMNDAHELFARTANTLTVLPTLGGATAEAMAINDAGIVVGSASLTNGTRTTAPVAYPARWTRDDSGAWVVAALTTISGGKAHAVNGAGDAVGTRMGSALVWPAGGDERRLGAGVALGINLDGVVVGGTEYGLASRGRVWTFDAPTASWLERELPPLDGGTLSLAFAISEAGRIAGAAATATGVWKAVVWSRTASGWSAPVLLPGLDGPSAGFGINATGDVVGYSRSCSSCPNHAFLWPVTGGSIDLNTLGSNVSSARALGIEDDGRAVGSFYTSGPGGTVNPFVWTPGALMLTDLGSGEANDINNGIGSFGREAVGSRESAKGKQAVVWAIR